MVVLALERIVDVDKAGFTTASGESAAPSGEVAGELDIGWVETPSSVGARGRVGRDDFFFALKTGFMLSRTFLRPLWGAEPLSVLSRKNWQTKCMSEGE